MSLDKFVPLSPDPDLNVGADMTLARFGHLNKLVDEINAGGGGGGGGVIDVGQGTASTIRVDVNNQAYGNYGMAIGGEYNTTCDDYTASLFGRGNCAVGCYSSSSGISNIIKARNSYIFGGNNNTIACDAPQITDGTRPSYSGAYYRIDWIDAPYPNPQIIKVGLANLDWTSSWNPGDTMSGFYTYGSGSVGIGPGCVGTGIQFTNAEIICATYENIPVLGGCGTYLYTCFDLNLPAWCGTIASGTPSPTTTFSQGYLQKTGTFSSYSTYSAYHPNVIVGGHNNTITGYATGATISGGYRNTISGGYASITGGSTNQIDYGGDIVGGYANYSISSSNTLTTGSINCAISSRNSILHGVQNCLNNSNFSILGGNLNLLTNSSNSVVLGGACNKNCDSPYGVILSSICSNISFSQYSIITNSSSSCIYNSRASSIMNSLSSMICGGGRYNSISGGYSNQIFGVISHNSIFGLCNTICTASNNNHIFGGANTILGNSNNNIIGSSNCIPLSCDAVNIFGVNMTANRSCATFVNNLSIMNIPTSSAGLPSGAVWSNSGILTIVP